MQSDHPTSLFRRKIEAGRAKYPDSDLHPLPPQHPHFKSFLRDYTNQLPNSFKTSVLAAKSPHFAPIKHYSNTGYLDSDELLTWRLNVQ